MLELIKFTVGGILALCVVLFLLAVLVEWLKIRSERRRREAIDFQRLGMAAPHIRPMGVPDLRIVRDEESVSIETDSPLFFDLSDPREPLVTISHERLEWYPDAQLLPREIVAPLIHEDD